MAGFMADEHNDEMSEINMIPFIDVMLVLLIVFIITVPALKHAVNIELPREQTEKEQTPPEMLSVSIAADGTFYIDNQIIPEEKIEEIFKQEAAKTPQPNLAIRGDKNVRYEKVTRIMAAAHQSGLTKIGFITDPGN